MLTKHFVPNPFNALKGPESFFLGDEQSRLPSVSDRQRRTAKKCHLQLTIDLFNDLSAFVADSLQPLAYSLT